MFPSPDQANAIHHPNFQQTWEPYELPTGPRQLPRWAKGLHVNWMNHAGNSPKLYLKSASDIGAWDGMRFIQDGSRYTAYHSDGRAVTHWHSGRIGLVKLTRQVRTSRTESHSENYEAYATTQQDGYGGRHYPITIGGKHELRGKTVILRGPWHSAPPPGYTPISYVDMSSEHVRRSIKLAERSKRWRHPWWDHTAFFGVDIRHDVLAAIAARYLPHLRFALVGCRGFSQLEAMKPEWDCPKDWWLRKQRSAA